MRYVGRVWVFGDNVSTDVIMPGSVTFSDSAMDDRQVALSSMSAIRPGWGERVRPGDIIVGGQNFGCGSGRPAPRILQALGISAVVAESMARQFFRNAIHIGLPAISCSRVGGAVEEGDVAELEIETGNVANRTQSTFLQGEALPVESPPYEILAAGGIEAYLRRILDRDIS